MDPVLYDLDRHLTYISQEPYDPIPSDIEIEEMAEYYGEMSIDDSFRTQEDEMISHLIAGESDES